MRRQENPIPNPATVLPRATQIELALSGQLDLDQTGAVIRLAAQRGDECCDFKFERVKSGGK